ncbi:MAG: hypothetical protein HQK75_08170 [Candidatus Magnetomorum sp.]|nr:hypothetical protein [Candidatus Magnetomorum sp.]
MIISEYLTNIKEYLLTHHVIHSFQIIRERSTLSDGHLRAKITFTNGDILEFSKYFHLTFTEKINIVTYSYHWTDKEHNLIVRWDNAPHFPELTNFPHHVHEGIENKVSSSTSLDIFNVIKLINQINSNI